MDARVISYQRVNAFDYIGYKLFSMMTPSLNSVSFFVMRNPWGTHTPSQLIWEFSEWINLLIDFFFS